MADSLRPLIEAAKGGDAAAINQLAGCVDRFVRIFSGSLSQSVRRAHGSTIDFEGQHTMSPEQIEWFRAGGALNIIRQKNRG